MLSFLHASRRGYRRDGIFPGVFLWDAWNKHGNVEDNVIIFFSPSRESINPLLLRPKTQYFSLLVSWLVFIPDSVALSYFLYLRGVVLFCYFLNKFSLFFKDFVTDKCFYCISCHGPLQSRFTWFGGIGFSAGIRPPRLTLHGSYKLMRQNNLIQFRV